MSFMSLGSLAIGLAALIYAISAAPRWENYLLIFSVIAACVFWVWRTTATPRSVPLRPARQKRRKGR